MARELNIAMIGTGFMGRAHSQAWASAAKFHNLPLKPLLHTVCGQSDRETAAFARRWGWNNFTSDLKSIVEDDTIDFIDVVTPNFVHAEHSMLGLNAGKHVACEKPLARTLTEARAMRDLAKKLRKLKTFVWFNYRRCPAVALAQQLVQDGRIGRTYHVRAAYLQDWGGPDTPLTWRYQKKLAGSGAHGDLNSHIIDMARFITGDEIVEVTGAHSETFIKRRKVSGRRTSGNSTVDDCVLFLARFKSGAVGSFEATRLAIGNLNRNKIEINGERGSVRFDFERMNELEYFDATVPKARRGWTTISCTDPDVHPFAAYWPPGHGLGYEHTFTSMAADIIRSIAGKKVIAPLPDFHDAYETQQVLEAAFLAAKSKRSVSMSRIP